MSRLLIDENPILIFPSLIKVLGTNGAIVIQKIHDKSFSCSGKLYMGRRFIKLSLEEIRNEISFLGLTTIRKTISNLKILGLLISENLNPDKMDRTMWYSVNYRDSGE